MNRKGKRKAWRLLSHEAFFRLSTQDKVAYLKAAVEQYGVYVDVKATASAAGRKKAR
jgi:hypothetical protein